MKRLVIVSLLLLGIGCGETSTTTDKREESVSIADGWSVDIDTVRACDGTAAYQLTGLHLVQCGLVPKWGRQGPRVPNGFTSVAMCLPTFYTVTNHDTGETLPLKTPPWYYQTGYRGTLCVPACPYNDANFGVYYWDPYTNPYAELDPATGYAIPPACPNGQPMAPMGNPFPQHPELRECGESAIARVGWGSCSAFGDPDPNDMECDFLWYPWETGDGLDTGCKMTLMDDWQGVSYPHAYTCVSPGKCGGEFHFTVPPQLYQ